MGRISLVVARGYRQWPALQGFNRAHCADCGALIVFNPESCGRAKCGSCVMVPSDVKAPTDVPLPAFQYADQPTIELRRFTKKGYHRPCPKCGGETWTEGNGRRSCLAGHVIRLNGEIVE